MDTEFVLGKPPSDEMLRASFNSAMDELNFTSGDLLKWMHRMGDYRDASATLRGIQRMISGETRISGPMMVIATSLVRQHRLFRSRFSDLNWTTDNYGNYVTQIEDWYVFITPKPKGRWLLSCRNGRKPTDYSPPFGRWLNSLDEAKRKAPMVVYEGMADIAYYAEEE